MGNLESLGDAVTGAVLGSAVEPGAGEASRHGTETHCLNCGTELTGRYCHECGQQAQIHRTLKAFFHDLLHGVLHFEGKIWRTLPLLAWRPGELTRRYVDGQRASFVSPIALFLFFVFLLFAVGGLTGGFDVGDNPRMKKDLSEQVAIERTALTKLQSERGRAIAEHRPIAAIDARIKSREEELNTLQTLQTKGVSITKENISGDLPHWLSDSLVHAAENPELILFKLKTNAYKYSWLLIPLSVPFVWLLFPFSRRFRLYDHVVFVTYSLCFMSLLAITAMLFGLAGLGAIAAFLALVPPVHMYRQLKGAYGLSRFGALWRATALTMFAFIAAGLFAAVVAGIGVAA
ncbi:MAG: DUF3667 domain-containing protein [Sphingomonas sp.]|nr:DUF3667 domain-containing protein [Sphingomonas sp.]